jgi:hypothetical protein
MIANRKYQHLIVIGLLGLSVISAHAAEPQVETCAAIRAQIKAQTGVLTKPDLKLLAKVGANKKCRFTEAEAYRAAYGDKPLPKGEGDARRERRGHAAE